MSLPPGHRPNAAEGGLSESPIVRRIRKRHLKRHFRYSGERRAGSSLNDSIEASWRSSASSRTCEGLVLLHSSTSFSNSRDGFLTLRPLHITAHVMFTRRWKLSSLSSQASDSSSVEAAGTPSRQGSSCASGSVGGRNDDNRTAGLASGQAVHTCQ